MRRSVLSLSLATLLLGGSVALSVALDQSNPSVDVSTFDRTTNVESTSLYCVGGSTAGRNGTGGVKFWNSSNETRHLDIRSAVDKNFIDTTATIAPKKTLFVPATSALIGSISVRAQIDGGGVVGSLFTTSLDSTSVPCQSEGVTDWYIAGLSTVTGTASRVTLLNPSATPAVVDVSTQSSLGFLAPAPYQGLVVPANGQLTLRLGEVIVEAKSLAVHVTALRGSFVASALYVNGEHASVLTGQSEIATDVSYASVNTNADATESLNLYNPGETATRVKIKLQLPGYQISPITVSVNPSATVAVPIVPATRVPTAGWGSLRVTSTQGVVSTLFSGGSGFLRLSSPTARGTTLAWISAMAHAGKVRVAPVEGQNVVITFTYFEGRRSVTTELKASAGEPVVAPDAWVAAGYGLVSAKTPLMMQGVVGTTGLESGLNGR
jgi:hypothetical protein